MATVISDVRAMPETAPLQRPRLWYKEAIIYQLHVRAYRDSDGDGVGDFRGLTECLDYVQDLGVTAIWLLPFFPSPLKDDGYDIADYCGVHPQYGTLADFQQFLEEAHRRDLKVITEMVLNHTSDQHAWFQRSRRARPGSPERDWYVWCDSPEKYQETRIIFQDFETSNWGWDQLAGAYYWHRFYSHQPDLNFDNPEVRQAVLEALDFWLDMGVDGLRLDAVPYLFEREGTNCENLPETHAFLRAVRHHIDEKYDDRMLLAEANQWPEDAAAYFGDGDECHMNFHFPLMPRLFMAVEREDRSPIVDILEQAPLLPHSCQWAIFLRNHDELTLEMVTDEERDYMYRTYAVDARARINLGIRRRLAPLMANNRRKIELMNALLLSLPGTPIVYYGDEIGMGDNYYLGDRNGVRTPMHWNGDRNAGFSRANPQSLYLPVIIDPEYHYELRNVEVQHGNPHSLLWWTRRIIDLRRQHPAFGEGSFESLSASNPKVFAFLRETDDETILVAANLSRYSQYAELDLSRFEGRTPVELFGRTTFPAIEARPYVLSLGPHSFYWLSVRERDAEADASEGELPSVELRGGWSSLLKGRPRKELGEALERYLRRHRWFGGKARTLTIVDVLESFDIETPMRAHLLLVKAMYTEGEPEVYILATAVGDPQAGEPSGIIQASEGILDISLAGEGRRVRLFEITRDESFWRDLLAMIRERRQLAGRRGSLVAMQTSAFTDLWNDAAAEATPVVHGGEQSNTSATIDEAFVLKLFRRITPGTNPDFEIGHKLAQAKRQVRVPAVAGALEYRPYTGQPSTVAILHEYVANVGDAWSYTLDELGRYLERMLAQTPEPALAVSGREARSAPAPPRSPASPLSLLDAEPSPLVEDALGSYLYAAELLGRRTAELHLALAEADGDPGFSPEPFTRLYQRGMYQSMRSQARAALNLLRTQRRRLPEDAERLADAILTREPEVLGRFSELLHMRLEASRIRCHGDYHLGQVLFTGKDFVIIDFEGEPDRPVSERRIKASPLRDVAGMLRSFHYASHSALREGAPPLPSGHSTALAHEWAQFWTAWVSATFLQSYVSEAQPGGFLPSDPRQLHTLLTAYLMDKALYELRYELNNRPDWAPIPLEGIRLLLDETAERL